MQGLTPFGQSPSYSLLLSQRLRNQDRSNNGTIPGGLAHMLNQGVAAFVQARDAGQRQAADQTYMDALTKPQKPVGGGSDYQQPNAPTVAPGVDAAIGRLSELKGNPYAGRLTRQLAMQQMAREQEAAASQRAFQQQLYRDQINNDARIRASAAGRSSVNVNTGNAAPQREFFGLPDLPRGFDYVRDQTGAPLVGPNGAVSLVPIAGGPNARDIEQEEAAKASKTEGEQRKTSLVLEDISRFREKIKNQSWFNPVSGLAGGLLANLPGTGAYDAARIADTIRANIGFDRLQKMRDESPTGGALGAVNNQEMQLLQAVWGSLDQAQTEDQLLRNLERLEGLYQGIATKLAAYPNAAQYGFGGGGETGNGITAMPRDDVPPPAAQAPAQSGGAPQGSAAAPWPVNGPDDPRIGRYAIGDRVRLPDGRVMRIGPENLEPDGGKRRLKYDPATGQFQEAR